MKTTHSITATLLVILVRLSTFQAATFAGDVQKANNTTSLDQPGSWLNNVAPAPTDFALWDSNVLTANSTPLNANQIWGGIKITNPGGLVTINGPGTLTLQGISNGTTVVGIDMSGTPAATTQDLTLAGSVALNANQSWNVASGRTLTSSGLISGAFGLIKDGPGTLTLNTTAKTYTNGTTVNAGTLVLGLGGGTGVIRGPLTVNAGGTVNLTAVNALGFTAGVEVNTLTINGGLVNNLVAGDNGWAIAINMTGGTLQSNGGASAAGATQLFSLGGGSSINTFASSTSATISGRVNLRETNPNGLLVITVAQGTVPNGQDLVFSAALTTGSTTATPLYGMTKAGPGNMVMAGAGLANYTGPLNVTGGTLTCGISFAGNASVLGDTNNAAAAARTITIGTGATMNWTTNNVMIGGGSAAIVLPTLNITGGTLTANNYNAIGNLVLNGGTLDTTAPGNATYHGYEFLGIVTVTGTTPSFITNSNANGMGNNLLNGTGTPFNVADVTGDANPDLVISNPLTDSSNDYNTAPTGNVGSLIKTGAGTMVLNAANTYTGTTTVNAGTLTVNGSILGTPVVNGGTLRLNAANIYTANTTVNAGGILALGVTGSIGNSPVITIANGGLLDVTAGGMTLGSLQTLVAGHAAPFSMDVSGNLTSGGTLDIAGTGVVGTVTINGNLVLNDQSRIKFDLSNNAASGNDQVVVGGNLNLSGTVAIVPNLLNVSLASGTYTLITYTGTLTGNASNLVISLPAGAGTSRQNFTLSTATAGRVQLIVGGAPATDTWKGTISNVWDVKTTANWINPVPNDGLYFDFDNVVFDSSSTVGGIELDSIVSPTSVLFNNTLTTPYALAGAGSISGSTGLIKNNTGFVTLGTTNSFTGPVAINNGEISVATLAVGGTSSGLGAGTAISLGDATHTGTLQYTGPSINTNRIITLNAGGGQIDVAAGTTLTETQGLLGTGALTKIGAGTLALTGSSNNPAGATLTAGTVSLVNGAALGTGPVTLNGGTLQLAQGAAGATGIGIHFSTGRAVTEIDNVTGTAGVVPIANWNNVPGITGSNVALTDSGGAATASQVTFSGGAVNYSAFGASQANQDQQLLNSYLDTNATNTTNTIVVSNIPYAAYRVYVYFGSDGNARTGHVSVGASTIYFSTDTNPFVGYVQATATTLATAAAATYALFDNQSGSTLTITQVRDSNNCGVMAVEIISISESVPNNVTVNANSTIDLTGTGSGAVGTLSIGGQMLSLTGTSVAANANFVLTLGATTLTGNPTFSPGTNGTGIGTLALGALNDGGTARTITIAAPGTLALNAPAANLVAGTQVTVAFGALTVNAVSALGSNAQLTLSNNTALNLNANQVIGSLASAFLSGNVNLGTHVLTIGSSDNLASSFAGKISGATGGLTKAGAGVLTLSGAETYSGATTVLNGVLALTGSIAGNPTSGTVQVGGAAAGGIPTLSGTGSLSGPTTIDSANGGAAGHLAPGVNTTGNRGSIGTLTTGTLTLNDGAVLDFDFGTPGSGTPSTGGLSDTISVNGNLVLPATGTVTVNLNDNAGADGNGAIAAGTYKLFSFTGQVVNSASVLQIGTTPLAGKNYFFTVIGNELDLTITSGVQSLTWNGAASSLWNTSANNWFNVSTSSTTNYVDGNLSNVIFQDAKPGGTGNVTNSTLAIQAGGVTPISVTFNNSSGGVPYTFTNPGGTLGITGTTGLLLAGSGTVTLKSANTYTGLTALNGGILQIFDNAAIGSTNGTIAPLSISGGTLSYLPGATNTDISGRLLTIGTGGAAIDTNGQTVSFANPIGNNGGGSLMLADQNATPGTLILTGANSYTGGTIINGGTLQLGDGTVDGTVLGPIQNTTGLIYNVVGSTANGGVISGTGPFVKNGAGLLALGANNTYLSSTTINAGTLSVKSTTALSAAPVTLNGGTLQLGSPADKIGIHFSTGRVATEIDLLTGPAGVVPMQNWNNVQGLTGTGVALNDNSGALNGSMLTFSGSPNSYSVYGGSQTNQDSQLLNSYLDNNATSTISVTISNIPFPSYRVYVYVASDGNARTGHVSLGATTTYFMTDANPFPGYIQATGTSVANANNATYALFDNLSGSSVTVTQANDTNNCGICGIEVVAIIGLGLNNSVTVTADSTIDVTGTSGAALGSLALANNTLNVTGGSTGVNANFILSLGTVLLNGNPTFNVVNNGTGIGTLSLGALGDGGTARTITLPGSGAVTLTAPATSLGLGTQVSVSGGTLNSNNATALGSGAQILLSSGGSFNVGATQTISSLATGVSGGNVRLGGNFLTVGASDNLSATFAGIISGAGQLIKAGTGTLTLSGANTYSADTIILGGTLLLTGSVIGTPASGALSAGGSSSAGTPTLAGTGTLGGATLVDSANGGAAGHLAPGLNTTGNTGGIGTLTTGGLTLNANAVLDFDFGTPGTGLPSSGGSSDSVTINGNLVLPSAGSIVLNLSNNADAGGNGSIGVGTYKLFTFTGQLVNFNANTSFVIGTSALAGKTYIFTQVGNELDLTVSNGVRNLVWTGAQNSLWNTTAVNWFNTTTSAATAYADNNLSIVTFQDALAGGAGNVTANNIVLQAGGVTPNFVAFTNTSGGVPFTLSNAGGTVGISGATGVQLSGSGSVTFQSPNTYTGLSLLSAGTLTVSDNADLGSSTGTIAPLTFNGGALQFAAGAANTDFSSRTVTINVNGATLDTNGQTISLDNPIGNAGVGGLTLNDSKATPGKLILGGANTFTGATTITHGTLQLGNGTADGSVPGNIADNDTLVFNVSFSNTYNGVISGTGSLAKNGAGALALSGTNTFAGGTTINAGTLSIPNKAALGTGAINLNGGTLQFANGAPGTAIGIHFSTGRAATEIDNVTGTAGVYPIANWVNVPGLTGTGIALNDSTGAAVASQLTFTGSADNYSAFGASQANQDQQLLNSYLDTSATAATNILTITNVPYPAYRVYVYFGSDANGRTGHVTVGASTIYFSTDTSPFVGYVQATATTPGGGLPSNYALFDNVNGGTLTITQVRDSNNCGIMAVEIVSIAEVLTNSVAVNANSGIDLTGANGASFGALTIGTQTLSITGGSTTLNANYVLAPGATTLSGNPTFNIAKNGSGNGTLSLPALNDGGAARTLTVNAGGTTSGTLLLTASSPGLANGTIASVGGGTLRLGAANALGSAPRIILAQSANLDGNGQQTGGTVRGFGTITGNLILASGASVWPGTDETVIPPLSADEQLNVASGVNVDLSNSAKLKIAITNIAGTVNTQVLSVAGSTTATGTVTLGVNSVLSLGVGTGTYAGAGPNGGIDIPILTGFVGSPVLTAKFGTVNGLPLNWSVIYQFLGSDLVADPSPANPADTIVVRTAAGGVTPVTIAAFTAHPEGAGVQVGWECVSEFQNAGFNVYRRIASEQESGRDWTRVNATLISGRLTNPDLKVYRMCDWAPAGTYEYKLESVSMFGACEGYALWAGPVTLDACDAVANVISADGIELALAGVKADSALARGHAMSAQFAARADLASPLPPEGGTPNEASLAYDGTGGLVLPARVRAVTAQPRTSQSAAASVASASARALNNQTSSFAAAARWFSASATAPRSYTAAKTVYSAPGVLKIPQAMLPAGFNFKHVTIQREGRTLTALALDSDGLIVFAPGYQDDYTDKDALFLRATGAATSAGQRALAQGLFTSAQPVNVNSPATATVQYHDVYFDYTLRPYTFPPWFSGQYLTGGSTQSFTLETPSASTGSATLTINLWSLTQSSVSPDRALQVFVNGRPAGQAVWSGGNKMMQLTFAIAAGVLNAGSNRIDLVTPALANVDTASSGQIAMLHSMSMDYTRALDGSSPVQVYNSTAAAQLFELNHLPSADAWVVDARFPDRAALIPYEAQPQADGTYTLRFSAPSGGSGQFLVVPAGQENLPIAVSKRAVKPLKAGTYLATGPSQFSAGVQPLLALRSKDGLRAAFADQEQLFDYYNNGRYGPAGIQNAVRAARPGYLLLLGRTTYDYRNYSGLNVDPLCPAFLVSTTFWAQATSDSMFGDLGRGYPEVAVGRLPVNDAGELSGAVNRIVAYTGAPQSGVRIHAAADRADPSTADFGAQTDGIAQANPDLTWQKNYLGSTYQSSPEVTAAMKDAANGGADWLLYVGHGNSVRLGKDDPRILQTDAQFDNVKDWTGNSVFLQSTCTANWMAQNATGFKSIAIQALTQPQGGISASIASSTYMNSDYAVEFMSRLLQNANASGMRWGDALMRAQQWAYSKSAGGSSYYGDLNRTEQIFGDPAMPVFQKSAAGPQKNPPQNGTSGGTTPANPPAAGTF